MLKAHEHMARCYQAMGNEEAAVLAYERACVSNPMSAVPFYQFAMYWLSKGDRGKAEDYFRKAVATDPQDPMAHELLGEFLINSGDREEGLIHYRKSLELRPLNPQLSKELDQLEPAPSAPPPKSPEVAN
jgi:Tfp pilus assembly protein PilF